MTATEQIGPTGQTMRQRIQMLIEKETDAVALRYALEALAKEDPKAFGEAADLWALPLYEHVGGVFNSFLSRYLTKEHKAQIDAILPRAEADGHTHLFRTLYQHVTDQERWNRDLLALAQSDKSAEEFKTAFDMRHQYNVKLDAETALALYWRDPKLVSGWIGHFDFEHGDFTALREAAQNLGDEDLYWNLFRHTADADLLRDQLLRLLVEDIPAEDIDKELVKRLPNHTLELEIPSEIWQRLIAKYGDAVVPALERNVKPFFRQQLEALLKSDLDNETVLRRLEVLSRQQWQYFNQLTDVWVLALYERDPIFFQSFLKNHLRWNNKTHEQTIRTLISRLEADGHVDLFRWLYSYYFTENDWNNDVLRLAQSDAPDEVVLQGLDVRSRKSYSLYIDAALALYRRNAALFGDFVRNRLRGQGRDLEKLSAEAKRSGDEETFWALYRESVDNKGWQAEMEALLARDIPADQIVAELEKRHPKHTGRIDHHILKRFLDKYGDAVVPYLERHLSLVSRKRLESLLAIPKDQIDRGRLLRELEKMARRQPEDFRALAWIWAPVLYEREPVFFESFLVRNLNAFNHAKIIHELLPRIEANGHDSLYRSLYRQIANESDWNYQIRMLAKSDDSDENVKRAIERRDPSRWFTLSEDTAITLYERNTALFRDYVKQHLHPNWYNRVSTRILDTFKLAGDDELYWWLFRESADPGEWEKEMKYLLAQDIPADQINAELQKRLPSSMYRHNANVLLSFLEKYGDSIMPLIERYSSNLQNVRLLEVAERLGDQSIYQRLFFQHGNSSDWNKLLRKLLGRSLPDDELMLELQRLTPDGESGWNRWGRRRWQLETDIALALYQRQPVAARPFLERFVNHVDLKLFEAANAAADEEFLDFITFQAMRETAMLVYRAYPQHTYWGWKQSDQDAARKQIEQLGAIALRRFDELYAHSPETYVRHAANILGRLRAFEVWRVGDQLAHNPIFAHLATRYHEAWHRSADGIRELMESTNIYVQLIGLEILSAGGGSPDAARRIVENKRMFQALLLGRTRRNTKKKVLNGLELAIRQGPEFAAELLPVLEATLDFRGKRAISERIIVSYARARRAQNAHEVTA